MPGAPELSAIQLLNEIDEDEVREQAERARSAPLAELPKGMPPEPQEMQRQDGDNAAPIDIAVEGLGRSITIKLTQIKYEVGHANTNMVDGEIKIIGSGREHLVLVFSSNNRSKGHLMASIRTTDRELIIAEFERVGGKYMGVPTAKSKEGVCEVKVNGVVHGSIPGGDALPRLRLANGKGGVQSQTTGCVCCPCQTHTSELLVTPSGATTVLASVPSGCCTMRLDARNMRCTLPGNAESRLNTLLLCAYMAANLVLMPPPHAA